MLRIKRLRIISPVQIPGTSRLLQRKRPSTSSQGSILVGIIITIVVIATLGAGMVYLTTTSTFQELFANNNARAYYVAESGGRHISFLIRQALATGTPSLDSLKTAFTGTAPTTGKFTMANGDQFQIANWDESELGPGGSKLINLDSTGIVNSGFLQARRKLHYKINPANQSGPPGAGGGPPVGFIDLKKYFPTKDSFVFGFGPSAIVRPSDEGTSIELKAESPGKGGVMFNNLMRYRGNFDVQVKVSAESAMDDWNIGIMFNLKPNAINVYPYGYGISYFDNWLDTGFTEIIPKAGYFTPPFDPVSRTLPLVLLWQNTPDTGFNWIAYARVDHISIAGSNSNSEKSGIQRDGNKNNWYLGRDMTMPPTLAIKVIRNKTATPPYNEIRAYIGGPKTQGTPDTTPHNYVNRRGYGLWNKSTPYNDIKWPPFDGTWGSAVSTTDRYTGDYFTMLYSDNITPPSTQIPNLIEWVINPAAVVTGTTTLTNDTTTKTGTTINNAVIRSTVLTGVDPADPNNDFSGVGLMMDATANPFFTFYDLAINATTDTGSKGIDGTGVVTQYP